MAESVSFSIFLTDHASKGLANFAENGKSAFATVDKALSDTEAKMKKFESGFGVNIGNSVGNLKGMVGGLLAGAGFVSLAQDLFNVGSQAEQTRIAFETFLKSPEAAAKQMAELQKFADVSPFNTSDVMEAGKTLLAFNVAAEDQISILNMLGDASGGNATKFGGLVEMYGKMNVATIAQNEDLNQMANAGIPVFDELQKILGKTPLEIKKMAESGISMDVINQMFRNLNSEGGLFFGMMEKQSQSTIGLWSTLTSKFEAFGVRAFNAMQPALNGLIGFGTVLMDNQPLIEAFGVGVGIVAGAWGLYTIAQGAAAVATWVTTGGIQALTAAMLANPFGIVVASLAAVGAGMYYAYQQSETFRGVVLGLWESVKTVFSNIANAAMQYLGGLGDIIGGIFNLDFEQLQRGFTSTLSGLKGATFGIGEGVVDSFNKGFADGLKPLEVEVTEKGKDGTANPATGFKTGLAGAGIGSGNSSTSSIKAGIAGVQGDSKQRSLSINIESLVKELSFHTTNMKEAPLMLENAVKEVLIKAVRDVEYIG